MLVFLLVLVVVLALLGGVHWYVWKRLVRDVTVAGGTARRLGTAAAFVLPVLSLAALVSGRAGAPFRLQQVVAWPGFLWLALLLYVTLALVVGEAVRPLLRRWLERRAAGAAAAGDGRDGTASAPEPTGSGPTGSRVGKPAGGPVAAAGGGASAPAGGLLTEVDAEPSPTGPQAEVPAATAASAAPEDGAETPAAPMRPVPPVRPVPPAPPPCRGGCSCRGSSAGPLPPPRWGPSDTGPTGCCAGPASRGSPCRSPRCRAPPMDTGSPSSPTSTSGRSWAAPTVSASSTPSTPPSPT